jgi:hypothetical protein
MPTEQIYLTYSALWRAAHLCGQLPILFINETSSNIVDTIYSVNLICNANCERKYTSVYLLLSTNLFAFVFRVLPYWRPE